MLLKGDDGEKQTSSIVKDDLRQMIGTGKNLIFIAKYHASTYDLIPLYEYLLDSIWICRASSRVGESISTVGPPRSARGLLDQKGNVTLLLVLL